MRYLAIVLAACGASPAAKPPQNAVPVAPIVAKPVETPTAKWIAKLKDPRETERAVTQLEQLGDPEAIVPIAEIWQMQGRPVQLLQVAIGLARPLSADDAKAQLLVDYEATGRPEHWAKLLPYLHRAIVERDDNYPRSIDSAMKAADTLGDAQLDLDGLAEVARGVPSKKGYVATIAAIRALGKFTADRQRAAHAMIEVTQLVRPPAGADRTSLENMSIYLGVIGASVNSLAQLRSADAIAPLVTLLYRAPELMMQLRRALVASGPNAIDALRAVLRGTNAAVEAMHLDKTCEDGDCHPVAARDFYASLVLGDLHAVAAVPELLAALKRPALPVYYLDGQPSPNTQLNAIADALRRIGSPDAAAPLRALWSSNAAIETRTLALAAYPFVARDASATADLAKLVRDPRTDESLRFEAATALSRISRDPRDREPFAKLAKKYQDVADRSAKAAAIKQPAADAAKREYQLAKDRGDDRVALKRARKKYGDSSAEYSRLFSSARENGAFARGILVNAARIEIASRCKDDLACYAAALTLTPDEVVANVAGLIPNAASWSDDDKRDLVAAAVERAMLELAKAGPAAATHTNALLAAANSNVRLIRQSILLALPAIAPRPCDACVPELDKAIAETEGNSTLADLKLETEILRNYFAWAK